jgi:hypothetical protein
MSKIDYECRLVERNEIQAFVEKWHYSKSINGVMTDYCFGLYDGDELVGAMIYGRLGMANAWKRYAHNPDHVIELRRLCCIDDTPKNTESYFIGKTIRWLKNNTELKAIISYADCNQNHEGTIYKASNFCFEGKTSPGRVIVRKEDGRQYHDKAVRTKYNGKLKPFAKKLKEELERGEAEYVETVGKNIYVYVIARTHAERKAWREWNEL